MITTGAGQRNATVLGVQRRIRHATGMTSYRELARSTGCHPETVRRYMTSGAPTMEFLMAICEGWDLNANWVLFGLGSKQGRDLTSPGMGQLKTEFVREVVRAVEKAVGEGMRECREESPPSPCEGQAVVDVKPALSGLHPPDQNGDRLASRQW